MLINVFAISEQASLSNLSWNLDGHHQIANVPTTMHLGLPL